MATDALLNLKSLSKLYSEANLEGKRYISGVIFPEKWVFDGKEHHTTKVNEAALLIYQINNKLQHKKTGAKSFENLNSGKVPSAGVELQITYSLIRCQQKPQINVFQHVDTN
jgi:hypothetical protein